MESTESEGKKASGARSQRRVQTLNRLPSAQIPARLRYGDDANEDVTAPNRTGPAASQYMNQSIFSMIAAAGSKADFHARFDESSDSDGDRPPPPRSHARSSGQKTQTRSDQTLSSNMAGAKDKTKDTSLQQPTQSTPRVSFTSPQEETKVRREAVTESPSSEHTSSSIYSDPREAPVMSRLLTAEAEFQADPELTRHTTGQGIVTSRQRAESTPATLLATRLMEIFGFTEPEAVIAEYPCWLLQSVLLQGYLYLTKYHICFYAFLPKKSKVVTKKGHLFKRGRTNPKYRRYWFTLKGDVLSYYSNPSDVYFPQGNIDLRYGISATLTAETDGQKDCKDFSVTTDQRTYFFRADSSESAKEWVKSLQKTIFRSHNDGDSVKISLPVERIIDIEESPVVEFAETVKLRVIESDDSYAVDEYFFSFFSHGEDALHTLGSLLAPNSTSRLSMDRISDQDDQPTERRSYEERGKRRSSKEKKLTRQKEIDDDLNAHTSPRSSFAPRTARERWQPARRQHDSDMNTNTDGRTSIGRSPSGERMSNYQRNDNSAGGQQESVASHTQSSNDQDTESSAVPLSPMVNARMSASQILSRSDVFHGREVDRLEPVLASSAEGDNEDSHNDAATTASLQHDIGSVQRDEVQRDEVQQSGGFRRSTTQIKSTGSDISDGRLVRNTSSPTLQELAGRVGSYPLSRAGAIAKYIQNRSSKMSKVLATESMSYLEKVTGMWQGGHKHYGENEGVVPDDKDVDPEDEEANVGHGDRFRAHFALPPSEKLQATYFGYLHRVLPLYGKVYVSNRLFCFRSLLPGTRTRMILPLKDVENVDKEKGFRFGYHGLVLVIRGHEELFFEFNSPDTRDDCTVTLLQNLESAKYLAESSLLARVEDEEEAIAQSENRLLQEVRSAPAHVTPTETTETLYSHADGTNILFDDPKASFIKLKSPKPLKITCLTIGSRGDVQPYIALCKGLIAEGHTTRIATHAEFGPWVESYGIKFTPIGGDPAELMRICIENGMFTYSFLREASSKFRTWIDDLLTSAWEACQGTELLIESPSTMAGIHIAEALNIPYFRAFTMPWTRTRAYPHAFAVPEHKIGGAYNYFSYVMFDNVFWKGIAGQVNRWRKRELGLQSTNLDKMQPNKVPFLYNFSPNVVAPPLDYSDWVKVTGYWFLDESQRFEPAANLVAFIKKARDDGKKLVYIGFGSIVVSDPEALTRTVVESVLKADVRCILSKGWSDRLGDPSSTKTEIPLPSDILQIKSAPHDWLFPQVDCAVHHGGAGTTGASLRAGIPTVIKPFFGDQFFFGGRVEDLGVGILLRKINVSVLARALWEACHSERMKSKATRLGEKIRSENGVNNAIQAIYRDLEYATNLVKSRNIVAKAAQEATSNANQGLNTGILDYETEADLDNEESWAFVGDDDEIDGELRKRLSEFKVEPIALRSSLARQPEGKH